MLKANIGIVGGGIGGVAVAVALQQAGIDAVVTWYAAVNVPPEHPGAPGGRKRELQEAFLGWHEPVADLIAATNDDEIIKNGAYGRAPLRRWGEGLVTLLGDAAHPCTPNLGQGGCMALEDAAVMA